MKRKASLCALSFFASLIFIGALCGFMAVDASVELYMPGRFGAMFELGGIDHTGVSFDFMGKSYRIDAAIMDEPRRIFTLYRAFFPIEPQIVSELTKKAYEEASELLEERAEAKRQANTYYFYQ